MAKVGRPSKYTKIESRLDEVEKLGRYGLTDKQLADWFEVSEESINEYKRKYPEFSQSLKKSKTIADTGVIDSLYKRAIGFEYEEITQEGVDDGKGGLKIKSVKRTKKYYPPDPLSCFYWLNNRMKEQWRQRVEDNQFEDEETIIPDVDKLSKDEVNKLYNDIRASRPN